MDDLITKINLYLTEKEEKVQMTKGEVDEYLSDLMESLFLFLDTLDMESLDDNQQELLQDFLDMYSDGEEEDENKVEEKVVSVIRAGKRVRKTVCNPGYKVLDGRCIKMSSAEQRVRRKAGIKSARKSRSKHATTARKRALSMKKRH